MAFPAARDRYPTKDEMADFVEAYAARFELPVRVGVSVEALAREGDGYVLATTAGWLAARRVIVATGAYTKPSVPKFAPQLDRAIRQLHSVAYRNPRQLRDGAVLIVGAGNSGAEIALDVARSTPHRVWLAGRDPGHIPAGYDRGRAAHLVAHVVVRLALSLTANTWPGRSLVRRAQAYMGGHPVVRVQPDDLKANGVQRVPRVAGVEAGRPQLADGRVLDVANILWCTGFVRDTLRGWIRRPIFDVNGLPRHHRGVVETEPGLYFLGLPFQSSVLSGIVASAGPDAQYVVKQTAERARATFPVYQVGGQPV
jgi:putative flavoprotein involved in K+ transport